MKTHTAYIQVPCSERSPKYGDIYIVLVDTKLDSIETEKLEYSPTFKQWEQLDMKKYHEDAEVIAWLEKREDVIVMTEEELDIAIKNAMKFVYKIESEIKS